MAPEVAFKTYQKLLARHGFGNALYFPKKTTEIFPGAIGYFNENGHWHALHVDLTSTDFAFSGDLSYEDTGSLRSPLILSENIERIELDVGAAAE
jgi:hypothetical protein